MERSVEDSLVCVLPERTEQKRIELPRSGQAYGLALFALYMFLHTVTLVLAHRGSTGLISAEQQTVLYYVIQAAVTLGFLSFALSRSLLRNGPGRTVLSWGVLVVYALGLAALFLHPTAGIFLLAGLAAVFCLGYLGGAIYCRLAVALSDGGSIGRVMGAGCALCYGGQYLFQHLLGDTLLLPLAVLGAFALIACAVVRHGLIAPARAEKREAERGESPVRALVCACVVMACLCALLGFLDGDLTRLAAASGFQTYDPYSWPRLMMIPSYLAFGRLGDVKGGKYVPLATLCVILVALMNPVLANYTLNMCLFYVGIGAMFSYGYLIFWRLAPRTACPELWASMGRLIDGTVTVALGAVQLAAFPRVAVVAMDAAAIAVIVIAFTVNGDLSLVEKKSAAHEASPAADPYDVLRETYSLSPREGEVLHALLETEDDLQDIADRLYISRRVLQRHITSIYQKTGTKSRVGLYKLLNATR